MLNAGFRYVVEAWTFLRQHSAGLNVEELLRHAYEVCQDAGLMEDLLQLPFTDTEQVMTPSSSSAEVPDMLAAHDCVWFFLGVLGEIFAVQHQCSKSGVPSSSLPAACQLRLCPEAEPNSEGQSHGMVQLVSLWGTREEGKLVTLLYKSLYFGGACVAQSVKRPDLGSGHGLVVREFEPRVGLCADILEPASDSVSPTLSAP